jgi:hypothetical protein
MVNKSTVILLKHRTLARGFLLVQLGLKGIHTIELINHVNYVRFCARGVVHATCCAIDDRSYLAGG